MTWAALAASTASARIGWTLEQCRELYGSETPCVPATAEITDSFTVGKIHVWIHFAADGKADSICYTRKKAEGDFTDPERKALMDRNCGELSWEHFAPWFKEEYWETHAPSPQTTVFFASRLNSDVYAGLWIRTDQFVIYKDKTIDKAIEQAATAKLQGL